MFYTWIRYRDEQGNQFDLREDVTPDEGQMPVKDYPTHVGPWGRDSKAAVDLRGESRGGYDTWRKAELVAEIDSRNEIADAIVIDAPANATKAVLLELLEADDAAAEDVVDDDVTTTSDPDGSGAGDPNNNTDADTLGKESE